MALHECIDCGKKLSSTAVTCNNCNSTDPFGAKRAEEKLTMQMVAAAVVLIVLVFLAFHFDLITTETIKNFFKHSAN